MLRMIGFVIGLGSVIPLTGFVTLRWASMGRDWIQPAVMFGILHALGTMWCLGIWYALKRRMVVSAGAWLARIYLLLAIPLSVVAVLAERRGLWSVSPHAIESFLSLFMMSVFVMVSPLTFLVLLGGAPIASQTVLLVANVAANTLWYLLVGRAFDQWVLRKAAPHG